MGCPVRQFDSGQPKQIVEIAGPANGDSDRGNAVLENEVPAGDPGQEFSQRGIGVGIG